MQRINNHLSVTFTSTEQNKSLQALRDSKSTQRKTWSETTRQEIQSKFLTCVESHEYKNLKFVKTSPKQLMIQLHSITKSQSRDFKNWQRLQSKGRTHHQPQAKTEILEERLIKIFSNLVKYEAPIMQKIGANFSSPSISKYMHVGYLISTIIGETLCRILELMDHDVVRINHTETGNSVLDAHFPYERHLPRLPRK